MGPQFSGSSPAGAVMSSLWSTVVRGIIASQISRIGTHRTSSQSITQMRRSANFRQLSDRALAAKRPDRRKNSGIRAGPMTRLISSQMPVAYPLLLRLMIA